MVVVLENSWDQEEEERRRGQTRRKEYPLHQKYRHPIQMGGAMIIITDNPISPRAPYW